MKKEGPNSRKFLINNFEINQTIQKLFELVSNVSTVYYPLDFIIQEFKFFSVFSIFIIKEEEL